MNLGEEHCFHLFNLKYEKAVDFFFFFEREKLETLLRKPF